MLKLDHKASRFTTLTVFNGPKLTDFTNQASKIPHNDSDEDKFTDMNPRLIHAHTLAPFNILLLTCTIFRLLPENLWMLLKFLACFEMLIQNLFNKLCMKFPYINSSLRYPTIILPQTLSVYCEEIYLQLYNFLMKTSRLFCFLPLC